MKVTRSSAAGSAQTWTYSERVAGHRSGHVDSGIARVGTDSTKVSALDPGPRAT